MKKNINGWVLRDGAGNCLMDYDIDKEAERLFASKREAINRINNSLYPLLVKRVKASAYEIEVVESRSPRVSEVYSLYRINTENDWKRLFT